jgi:HPt (histidine-containing phosphotransfer) domain-containing protein
VKENEARREAGERLVEGESDFVIVDLVMPDMACPGSNESSSPERNRESAAGGGSCAPIIVDSPTVQEKKSDQRLAQELSGPEPDCSRVFNREATLERLGHDEDLFAEAARLFLRETPVLLGRLRQALVAGDGTALQFAAHSLKGMAANFEARGLVAEARRLELLGYDGDLSGACEALRDLERELTRVVAALEAVTVV